MPLDRLKTSILLVEDSPADARLVKEMLVDEGASFELVVAGSIEAAMKRLGQDSFDIVLMDLVLPDGQGINAFKALHEKASGVPFVVFTGLSDEALAIKAVQEGAQDYLVKGRVSGALLVRSIRYAIERHRSERTFARTGGAEEGGKREGERQSVEMVGSSPGYRKVLRLIDIVAKTSRTSVLLQSETGTGKEIIANMIHYRSGRRNGPFIKLNCSSVPETLLESEMFGYEKGAFTDARQDKLGLLELADGGTIFLDEIGDMALALQPKLLQFLENRMFRRVGGTRDISVDVRVIAATNKDLKSMVEKKLFREDLYYRLNVMIISMPPLRERPEDIVPIAEHYIAHYLKVLGSEAKALSPEARKILLGYRWPGNVRELRNVIERAVILSGELDEILPEHISSDVSGHAPESIGTSPSFTSDVMTLAELEERYAAYILEMVGGNKTRAAEVLGISRPTLREKLKGRLSHSQPKGQRL